VDIYSKGFTIVELMIAITILAVTMMFAAPSFTTMISNNRISAAANEFIGALQLAKAESTARIAPATICKRNGDGSGCAAGGSWKDGWIVFADLNGDGAVDNDDTVILNHAELDTRITFNSTGGIADFITYNPSGITTITGVQVLMMCDDRGYAKSAKGILITITGRGSVMNGPDTGQLTCL